MNTLTRSMLRLLAGLLALVLLAACGGGDDPDPDDAASDDASEATDGAAEDYIEGAEGVTLTEPGTDLSLKESAVVAWRPRQKSVATAEIEVRKIERTSFDETFVGFKVTDEMAAMTPYFVRAQVVNSVDADLGKLPVPLYMQDDAGTLIEPNVIQGKFKHCKGYELPKKFKKAGDKAGLCFVYFVAHGRKPENVAFSVPGGLEPITWAGDVKRYKVPGDGSDEPGDDADDDADDSES